MSLPRAFYSSVSGSASVTGRVLAGVFNVVSGDALLKKRQLRENFTMDDCDERPLSLQVGTVALGIFPAGIGGAWLISMVSIGTIAPLVAVMAIAELFLLPAQLNAIYRAGKHDKDQSAVINTVINQSKKLKI